MSIKKCCLLMITWILVSAGYTFSAEAAEPEMILELREGEQLFLPDKGEISIADENIVRTGHNGKIQAVEEGETEVVIRYKLRVKKITDKEEEQGKDAEEDKTEEDKTEQGKAETDQEKIEKDKAEQDKEGSDKEGSDKAESDKEESSRPEEERPQSDKASSDKKDTEKDGEREMTELPLPDVSAPVVVMQNLNQLSANNVSVSPVIRIEDENLKPSAAELWLEGKRTGRKALYPVIKKEEKSMCMYLDEIREDDEYTLNCIVRDTYGNCTEQKWIFTVNQSGTRFTCIGESNIKKNSRAPEIELENLDAVEVLACLVNGEPVSYEWAEGKIRIPKENLKNGKNRISLTVRDQAGNTSEMEPWDFVAEGETKESNTEISKEIEKETKMQKESPLGMIFLLIGSVLVFWEKKLWYNDRKDSGTFGRF